MLNPQVAPYGSWRSPISADLAAGSSVGFAQLSFDGGTLYWLESRPTQRGRVVLVRRTPDGLTSDVTPQPFSVRSRVHEYGGGAYTVRQGAIYFSNAADNRLYRQEPEQTPVPITPESHARYADLIVDARHNRVICVREEHTSEAIINTLVAVDLAAAAPDIVLASGNDFYAAPRLSPDGQQLVYLTWNLPDMPWDSTELWLARIAADGSLAESKRIAGSREESIAQPEWSPDGTLVFVSDRSDWWNVYRWSAGEVATVVAMEAEFALPHWVFGTTTYGFRSGGELVCAVNKNNIDYLARIDLSSGTVRWIDLPYTRIAGPHVKRDTIVFVGGSPTKPSEIVQLDLTNDAITVLARSSDLAIDQGFFSKPQAIEFPTENDLTAHAFFYPPHNPAFAGPEGMLPPLLVFSHSGPTSATTASFSLAIQYWTSRGFGVVDVNYGGSTGYGRAYRQRLYGNWGIVDVNDCVNAARYLVEQGLADNNRLAIRGSSAGGYTTLCALTFRDVFKAGASRYGISDLEALEQETHKFEQGYNHRLIGPYPERRDLYYERSPIHFTERLSSPMILFQGAEDKVVPPDQAEKMYAAVRQKGLPVAYVLFPDEGHGFRKAETLRRVLEAELYFYAKVFGFDPADRIEPVPIANV